MRTFNYLFIVLSIIIIIYGIYEFLKNDNVNLNTKYLKIKKRLVCAVLVFLISLVMNIVISISGNVSNEYLSDKNNLVEINDVHLNYNNIWDDDNTNIYEDVNKSDYSILELESDKDESDLEEDTDYVDNTSFVNSSDLDNNINNKNDDVYNEKNIIEYNDEIDDINYNDSYDYIISEWKSSDNYNKININSTNEDSIIESSNSSVKSDNNFYNNSIIDSSKSNDNTSNSIKNDKNITTNSINNNNKESISNNNINNKINNSVYENKLKEEEKNDVNILDSNKSNVPSNTHEKIVNSQPLASKVESFVYYNQCDSAWQTKGFCKSGYSMCGNGCGATAIAMVASTLGSNKNVTPIDVRDYLCNNKLHGNGGMAYEPFTNSGLLNNYGLNGRVFIDYNDYSKYDDNKALSIKKEVDNGNGVILLIPGHYVVLGKDKKCNKDQVYMYDPASRSDSGCYTMGELWTKTWNRKNRCYNQKKCGWRMAWSYTSK